MRSVVFLAALALAGCSDAEPQWKGWIYPDAADLTEDIPLGRFTSLEECRASAIKLLWRLPEPTFLNGVRIIGDYECGYHCEVDEDMGGLNVCEKTEK